MESQKPHVPHLTHLSPAEAEYKVNKAFPANTWPTYRDKMKQLTQNTSDAWVVLVTDALCLQYLSFTQLQMW